MFHVLFLLMLIPWLVNDTSDTAENEGSPWDSRGRAGETAEARLYRLAAEHGGRLTVSDVVVTLGIPVRESQSRLEEMVDDRYVRMTVTEHGTPRFEFPELMTNPENHQERS